MNVKHTVVKVWEPPHACWPASQLGEEVAKGMRRTPPRMAARSAWCIALVWLALGACKCCGGCTCQPGGCRRIQALTRVRMSQQWVTCARMMQRAS